MSVISCPSHLWKSIHEGIHEPLKLTGGLSCKYCQHFQRKKRQTDSHRHGKEKWHILLIITCLNDEERKKKGKTTEKGKPSGITWYDTNPALISALGWNIDA